MRSPANLVSIVLLWTTHVVANTVNETALAELPSCVKSCSAKVLSIHDCTLADPCFCEDSELAASLSACMMEARCSFDDQLAALKFQADACGQRPRDRRPLLSAVSYTLFGISTVFTLARALSRWPRLGGVGFGWDDYTAFVAYTLLAGMTAGDWFAIHYGEGRYIYALIADSISLFLRWFYICNILYTAVIFMTKISLVLLYLRIWTNFEGEMPKFKALCSFTLVGLVVTTISFTFVCIFQCIPVSYVWTFITGSTGKCIDRTAWLWALSGTDIGWDVVVILLPIPTLVTLKVSNPKKIGICFVFLVGVMVTICSFVRLRYISGFTTHMNFTYFYSYIGLWSSVEAYLSQICCCTLAMSGLMRRICTYAQRSRHNSVLSDPSLTATAVSGTQFGIFDPPSTSNATDDIEKFSTSKDSSADRSQDSAPSPAIPLSPGQRSPPTPSPPPKHPSRAFVTTHHDISGGRDTPDILYHDHFNNVRLEVTDPPEAPIRAQLRYIDRNQRCHDIELQGEYRRPSTPRPSSRRAVRYSPRTMSPELVPFAKAKPSWDTLKE